MEPARGSAATTVTARLRRWLAGWGLKEWRRAGLVAVLVTTAAFGGLDTVNKKVVDITAGETFDTGRFEVTVQRATLVDEVRAGSKVHYSKKPGRRYLGLVVTARNHGSLPGILPGPVRIVGLSNSFSLPPMRMADGTLSVFAGPGLNDEIVLLWEVPQDSVEVGSELTVHVRKEVRKLSATYGQAWVSGPSSYGRLTIPVGGAR